MCQPSAVGSYWRRRLTSCSPSTSCSASARRASLVVTPRCHLVRHHHAASLPFRCTASPPPSQFPSTSTGCGMGRDVRRRGLGRGGMGPVRWAASIALTHWLCFAAAVCPLRYENSRTSELVTDWKDIARIYLKGALLTRRHPLCRAAAAQHNNAGRHGVCSVCFVVVSSRNNAVARVCAATWGIAP